MYEGLNIQKASTDISSSLTLQGQSSQAKPGSSEIRPERTNKQDRATITPESHSESLSLETGREALETVLFRLNADVSRINERYSFQIDQRTDQLVVQVKDSQGEVIRQVPPETILEISSNIRRMVGLFLDQSA